MSDRSDRTNLSLISPVSLRDAEGDPLDISSRDALGVMDMRANELLRLILEELLEMNQHLREITDAEFLEEVKE